MMPHVPGIGGFVGQMANAARPPLSVRAIRQTAANATEWITVNLPTYAVGDLLLVTICVLGSGSNFVDPTDIPAPWTALTPYTTSTSSGFKYMRSFYWFATDLSQTSFFLLTSTGIGQPDWGGNAIAIIGADPLKAPIASNTLGLSGTGSATLDPAGVFPSGDPTGPTLYVASGATQSVNVSVWPTQYTDNRTQSITTGGARPHLATTKKAGGGALDPSAYTLSAAGRAGFQQVAVRGDS